MFFASKPPGIPLNKLPPLPLTPKSREIERDLRDLLEIELNGAKLCFEDNEWHIGEHGVFIITNKNAILMIIMASCDDGGDD